MLTILTCEILLANDYVIPLIQILRWNFVRRQAAMHVVDCARRPRLRILIACFCLYLTGFAIPLAEGDQDYAS